MSARERAGVVAHSMGLSLNHPKRDVLFGQPTVGSPTVEDRNRRLAQNEALFREVNERVRDIATKLGDDGGYEYFCECANKDCTYRISLRLADYEKIRSDARQFVVRPDHFTPEVETLVLKTDAFWVVRKTGDVGAYVEQLD